MFFKLISRNSKRNRKENRLLFSSLLISIIAFYIILSLPNQDVMIFLADMESDAVKKMLMMIPIFFGITLLILFFLIYYTSKFGLERRRHELGVYLMMGMRRIKLFTMLLAEDFRNSIISLIIGLPVAILLSELISLITARLVGLGIVGHQISFSWNAVLWTTIGFILIKFMAFLILSAKISRQEIGSLLVEAPDGVKKQLPTFIYPILILLGGICLAIAYFMAIDGDVWNEPTLMGLSVILGFLGTITFFWGLRFLINLAVKAEKKDRQLHLFNLRQIHETVIHCSNILAICSLLILAALCCFGSGVAISRFYGQLDQRVMDYTFENVTSINDVANIRQTLEDYQLDTQFSDLFEMRVGQIRTNIDTNNAFQMETIITDLQELKSSKDKDKLLNILQYATYPYLLSLSSYNQLLSVAGLPNLTLDTDEAAVYMDNKFTSDEGIRLVNNILEKKPQTYLDGKSLYLNGEVQTTNIVTNSYIRLSFALVLPDETFEYYTQGEYDIYLNGVLKKSEIQNTSLMSAISTMNHKLDKTGLNYESYLQNMGRQLFYMVAASYITIYLAIIFLIISNTIIGVQFLINQQNSRRRYRTLIHLGATHAVLCKSARKQINWYFIIPVAVAAFNSMFGVYALLTGILSYDAKNNLPEMMIISGAMILILCVVEYIYITVVKRTSDHYLLSLMVPQREE